MVHCHRHRTEVHPISEQTPKSTQGGHRSKAQAESFMQPLVLKGYRILRSKTLMDNKHSTACSAPMLGLLRAKKSISQVIHVRTILPWSKSQAGESLLLPWWFTIKNFILVTQQLLLEGKYQGQNTPERQQNARICYPWSPTQVADKSLRVSQVWTAEVPPHYPDNYGNLHLPAHA